MPGEFAADGLLRIAALDELTPAFRIRLLDEAFGRASEAQQPFKRQSLMMNRSANAGFLEHAYRQDLDALSLRVRAVQAMLPLDAAKARQLFADIPPLDLPLVPCDDFLVFDVDRYYEALGQILQRAFTLKEVRDGVAYQFLQDRISAIASPAQLAPAMRAVLSAGLGNASFQNAIAALTGALRRTAGDDRTFTYYLPAVGDQVQALIKECQRRETSPLPLIEAYRLYLIVNFSAPRCADDDIFPGSGASGAAGSLDRRSADAIRFFNENIRVTPVLPIQPTEALPSSQAGAAGGLRSCESPECKALARQYRALIFNADASVIPSAARQTPEWQEQVSLFLLALGDWQDSAGADAVQQFREKCAFYGDLVGLMPDPRSRETAFRAMLEFLQRSRTPSIGRIEWLLPVSTLIGRIGLDPLGFDRVADEIRRAGDPVIALYAELEKLAPRPAGDILLLM